MEKGTGMAANVAHSILQLELEGPCAPLGDITVQHGALVEADGTLAVDQDNGVRPESESERDFVSRDFHFKGISGHRNDLP